MKKPKRITKLTVETERTFIFRSRGGARVGWCGVCGAEVAMACVAEAARAAGLSEMMLYRLVETGALHSAEDADGRLLVCLNSLRR